MTDQAYGCIQFTERHVRLDTLMASTPTAGLAEFSSHATCSPVTAHDILSKEQQAVLTPGSLHLSIRH